MTDKELRKMSRGELLEMLIKEREENESLQTRLTASTTELLEKNNQLAAMQDQVDEAKKQVEEAHEARTAAETDLETERKEKEDLESKIEQMQEQLEDRRIQLTEAGSIAEASMRIHGIYQAAQESADQYLENIREMQKNQQAESDRLLEETRVETARMMASCKTMCESKYKEADEYYSEKKKDADAMHDSMMAATKKEVETYWNSLSGRLESFYDAHSGMREVLSFYNMKLPKLGEKPEDEHE